MDTLNLPKNFNLSRENMKATLEAFKADKSVADMTRKVFNSVSQTSAPASTRFLAPVAGSSRYIVLKASALDKMPTSAKYSAKN